MFLESPPKSPLPILVMVPLETVVVRVTEGCSPTQPDGDTVYQIVFTSTPSGQFVGGRNEWFVFYEFRIDISDLQFRQDIFLISRNCENFLNFQKSWSKPHPTVGVMSGTMVIPRQLSNPRDRESSLAEFPHSERNIIDSRHPHVYRKSVWG